MEPPKRKPTRLKEYDYSTAGAYFVTVCTKNRKCIFWNKRRDNPCGCPLPHDEMYSPYGNIANAMVSKTANKFNVIIDSYAKGKPFSSCFPLKNPLSKRPKG